jgi:hypothetical protein
MRKAIDKTTLTLKYKSTKRGTMSNGNFIGLYFVGSSPLI